MCGDLNFLKWSFLDFHSPAVHTKSCLLLGKTLCLVRGRKFSKELLEFAQVLFTFPVWILENKLLPLFLEGMAQLIMSTHTLRCRSSFALDRYGPDGALSRALPCTR